MSARLKKIFLGVFLFIFASVALVRPAPARAGLGDIFDFFGKAADTMTALGSCQDEGQNFIECLLTNIFDVGIDIGSLVLGIDPDTSTIQSRGILPAMNQGIAYLYQTPPAKTSQYIAYVRQNLHLAPQASAQGVGYQGLSPVLGVWTIFRNLAYFIFVIIFIVAGFMIMFRTKIDAQTVISLENALPRLIVSLILVTFSFAIAGFLIDIMYFLTFLAIRLFYGLSNTKITDVLFNTPIWKVFFQELWAKPFNPDTGIAEGVSNAIGNVVRGIFGGIAGQALGFAAEKVLVFLLGIALIYVFLSLGRILLVAFISIVIAVIFSPIILVFNVLPGSNAFSNWIKNLLSNILIFPGVAIFIIIAGIMSGATTFKIDNLGYTQGATATTFAPPLFGPLTQDVNTLQSVLAIGFLFMLPSIAQMIKDALKVEPFKYQKDLFAPLGAALWYPRLLLSQRAERVKMQKEEEMLRRALSPQRG